MKRNTIIALVIGIVIILAALYFLFLKPTPATTVESTQPLSPEQSTFQNLTSQLEPIQFDQSILSDPRFLKLQDIHTAIVPEPAGRVDPFAPL